MMSTKAPSPLRSAGALQIVIIGAGHNGLITAFYLAKAGLRPLVLERRSVVGGACVTEEIHPGFRCSPLAQSTGPLLPALNKDLQLDREDFGLVLTSARVFAPNLNGPSVCIYDDDKRTTAELRATSASDADAYPEFVSTFKRI